MAVRTVDPCSQAYRSSTRTKKLLSRIVVSDVDDVTKATDLHISTNGINSDPLTQFASVFSAQEDPDLALFYRNKSIAEQKSFDIAWCLLMDPKYLDLRGCIYTSQAELERFRQLVVNCVTLGVRPGRYHTASPVDATTRRYPINRRTMPSIGGAHESYNALQ